ncbi:MAG: hypothetical protein KF781_08530 [Chitinophagaceae bacterium]|nr:hypothetical protein [Chitinophagaceae bacterium]
MRKTTIQILIATMLLTGCKNSVKQADEYFQQQSETVIGDEIIFLTSTINFLYYANPTNYWYPEEYTFQDILDDKYQRGYRGLTRLDEEIHTIPDYDTEVTEAITDLEKEISAAKKEIKKKQSAIENMNGLFGMMTFGGLSGLMDFGKALSTEEEREKAEEQGRAMPEKVKISLENLTDVLFGKYRTLADKMYELENGAFEKVKPSFDEKSKIRYNLKMLVREKVRQQYNSQDTISRDEMIKQIFDYYDKEFKLTNQ